MSGSKPGDGFNTTLQNFNGAGLFVRLMEERDLAAALRLSTATGWNQIAADWQLFSRRSPEGCFVTVHDESVVGTVTTISYGEVAWISMMLVDAAFQRMGIGRALMERALAHLADMPCIKLDATPAGQPLYEKLGFVVEDELSRWTCAALPQHADSPANKEQRAQPIQRHRLARITDYDCEVFGAPRAGVLRSLCEVAPHCARQFQQDDSLLGFSLGRPGSLFHQIGPVAAADVESAKIVTDAALQSLTGQAVVMDVPSVQSEYSAWLHSRGFVRQRPLRRMVKGSEPQTFPLQQFAIVGPEFG